MKVCPYCSEKVQDEAKKCKHCGEWLSKEKSDSITDMTTINKELLESRTGRINWVLKLGKWFLAIGIIIFLVHLSCGDINCSNNSNETIKNLVKIYLFIIFYNVIGYSWDLLKTKRGNSETSK